MICVNKNSPPPDGEEKSLHEEIKELVKLLDEGICEVMGQAPISLKSVKLDKIPNEVGIFKGLGEKLKKVKLPDHEFILLLHEWIMKSLEHLSMIYEYDMIETMSGRNPISIDAKSEEELVVICIYHETNLHHKLTLNFRKEK